MDTITTTIYRAMDGREFDNEIDCRFHEDMLRRHTVHAELQHSKDGFIYSTPMSTYVVHAVEGRATCHVSRPFPVERPDNNNNLIYATAVVTCLELHDDLPAPLDGFSDNTAEDVLSRLYTETGSDDAFRQHLETHVLVLLPNQAVIIHLGQLPNLEIAKCVTVEGFETRK